MLAHAPRQLFKSKRGKGNRRAQNCRDPLRSDVIGSPGHYFQRFGLDWYASTEPL